LSKLLGVDVCYVGLLKPMITSVVSLNYIKNIYISTMFYVCQ
jgi:hypothetical protein